MGKKKITQKRTLWYSKPKYVIPFIFTFSVLIRFFCSYCFSAGPTVFIDEGLYINIARSLATQGQVLYRAQPISYVYLLYPLSIMPVFWLPSWVNVYRVVQFLNTIMISSMVFPLYLICRQANLRESYSYTVCLISTALPEVCLTSYLVAESLIYPMMIWLFYLALRIIRIPRRIMPFALFGLLNGVAYFAKPECIVFGVCFLIVWLINGIHSHERSNILQSLSSFVCIGFTILLGYWIYNTFFGTATALNLYEKQIPTFNIENILIMLQGIFFHIFAFSICAGGAFLLIPVFGLNQQQKENRIFFSSILLSLFITIIGIGIMIVPFRYTGSWGTCPVHLRYLMYFLPVFLVWLFLPEFEYMRLSPAAHISLLTVTALFIYPSAFHCFSTQAGAYDSPGLNIFFAYRTGYSLGIFCIVVLTLLNLQLISQMRKKGYTPKSRTLAVTIAFIFMLTNGIMAYRNSFSIDRAYQKESAHVAAALADQDFVIVGNNLYDDFRGFQLDAHLHRPAQMVVMNNMLLNAVETGGIYTPFTPLTQAPNTNNLPLIDTDTLLFDVTTADYVEFTEHVTVSNSPLKNYTIARITPGKPYLKTAIASMDAYMLSPENIASLLIFDTNILDRGYITLHISMRANTQNASVTFSSQGQSTTVEATPQLQTYSVTLPISSTNDFYHYTIQTSDSIIVHGYSTE